VNADMENQNILKGRVKTSESEEIEVPIRLLMNEFIPSVVAHHMTLQTTAGNVVIAFYEANPPIMLNPTPELFEKLQIEGFTAECVARISVSTSTFLTVADVFTRVAEQMRAKENENESQDSIPEKD
jgi:hypothetical protein